MASWLVAVGFAAVLLGQADADGTSDASQEAIEKAIRELGDSLAAVVVECPSNPLIRVCELHRVAEAVREQGGVMVIDPTIASIYNVDVLPCADLLITSLTKYAAIEGDVMIGALALNPESP